MNMHCCCCLFYIALFDDCEYTFIPGPLLIMSGQRRSFFIPLLLTATAVCTAARGVSLQELIHRATRARTEDYAEKRAGRVRAAVADGE
jgi:hypothetical protein